MMQAPKIARMPSPFPPMGTPAPYDDSSPIRGKPRFPPMRTPMPMPRQSPFPQLPPIFGGGQMPPQAPLPQQPRAQAGGIADLFAALQGGGNSSLYDQMAPPPAEAGPSPYADFQYLLDTPVDQRGFGYVPPVDEAYGVDLGPIDPSDIDTRTPEEFNEPMDVFDMPIMAPPPSNMRDIYNEPPPSGTIDQVIPAGTPIEQDLGNSPAANPYQANVDFMNNIAQENALQGGMSPSYSYDPQTGQYARDSSSLGLTGDAAMTYYSPEEFESEFGRALGKMPSNQANPVASDPAGTNISLPSGGSFLLTPDMQARIDEMQAKVAANQAAPAANPAMTMSPEELAALRERLGNMNFGGFGGNFNIPTQAVAPAVAPTTTPESLMAQMSSNPFIGNFDREELMARIEAMQAQNAGNPVKMNGPRTISGGGSTVKTGAPKPIPMYRGGR